MCRIFKAMDQKGDCNLDVDDFRWGLMDFGIQISKDEGAEIVNAFSKDGSSVNYEIFMDQFKVSNFAIFFLNFRLIPIFSHLVTCK